MMNQHVCRCCLLENPALTYNIFDEDNLRSELLMFLTPNVKIEPDDGLSELICELCWLRLREALNFRQRCEEADRELRKRYEDTNKAIEVALGSGILERLEHDVNVLILEHFEGDSMKEESHIQAPVEFEMLNDFLLDDSFSSMPDSNDSMNSNEEDPIISELLSKFLNDPSYDNVSSTTSTTTNSLIDPITQEHNTSSCVTSTTTSIPQSSLKSKNSSTKSPKSLHPCTECEKKFTRNFQLKLHMISVHNLGDGLQYNCLECQKTFASRHSLNYHKKSIHSAERPFACNLCQRRFILRTQLVSHMRIHTGETKPRIHECMECGKCWPTKSDLRTHMRSHDPDVERPFKCGRCEKRFFTRGHLNSHVLVHTGEKPFTCQLCVKSYQSVGNLNNHLVRRHADVLLEKAGQQSQQQTAVVES